VSINASGTAVLNYRPRKLKPRRFFFAGRLVWGGFVKIIQRVTHIKPGNLLEYRLSYSVRDVVSDKSRAVRDQMEALAQAVQKAGSYQAKDEATRAFQAVMEALNELVPPDVLMKLSESLPVREAARLRRAAAERLRKGEEGESDS
jgi:uncharacterized protein (DUF2267 family)